MKFFACSIAIVFLLGACSSKPDPAITHDIAALRAQIAELQAHQAAAIPPPVELGQQMLDLQIRHARLWSAGEAGNWTLAQFQVSELNELLEGVVEQNGDHNALQPQRLADVLPAIMDPAVSKLRDAIDHQNRAEFESAYDGLSAACSACHKVAGHDFLVIQRPTVPFLDNLKSKP